MTPPRIRLTLLPEPLGLVDMRIGDSVTRLHGEREIIVEEIDQLEGQPRTIGYLAVPIEALPQLGALGVLVGLGVLAHLEIVGDGAPPVYQLSPREARLLKIAAKVLG